MSIKEVFVVYKAVSIAESEYLIMCGGSNQFPKSRSGNLYTKVIHQAILII